MSLSPTEQVRILGLYNEKPPAEPTPDQLRAADHPETVEQLKQQVLELRLALQTNRQLHSLCKRFINKYKLQHSGSVDKVALHSPLAGDLIKNICECIGYDP